MVSPSLEMPPLLADGTCERSGDQVVQRELEQWFLRITAYADELLSSLDDLDWPEPWHQDHTSNDPKRIAVPSG